jgi:hypothetical protein
MRSSEILAEWLTWAERKDSPYSFLVIDVNEKSNPTQKHLESLAGCIRDAYLDPEVLSKLIDNYGADAVLAKIVRPGIPTLKTVKRGDFGEIVANGILRYFHSYEIPVEKLRFKISGNQTLPGIDVLALHLRDEKNIEEICFVESKLRTVRDNNVGIDGYKQLKQDYDRNSSVILRFVATRLASKNDAVAEAFVNYFFSREDTRSIETFRLFLFFDSSKWSETTLDNLNENGVELSNFTAHVARIRELRQMTDTVFGMLNVENVEDE